MSDFRTLHPRGVSAKISTEKLSLNSPFEGCGTYPKDVGVISSTLNPQGRPALDHWQPDSETSSIQIGRMEHFYSCQRSYGGYATAYVLVVLIYTQVATSARNRINMRKKRTVTGN
jgi:hypothetical protein